MTKLNLLLLPLLTCLCVLSSCNPEVRPPSQPAVEAAGPQALLERLEAANTHWDYAALLSLMEPDQRSNFQFVLDESRRYSDKVQQVEGVIRQKIGARQAEKFRESVFPGIFATPFGQAEDRGRVNWSKVQVNVTSDTAAVRTDVPDSLNFTLHRVDGQWYLAGDYFLRRAGVEGLAWYTRLFNHHIQTLDSIEADVDSGVINKGNFDKRFEKPKKSREP